MQNTFENIDNGWISSFNRKFFAIGFVTILVFGTLFILGNGDASVTMESRWNYRRAGQFIASMPSMSPDGGTFTYDSCQAGSNYSYAISKVDRDGKGPVKVLISPDVLRHPMYSPDGQHIVFVKDTGGYEHVWMMDSDGSNRVQLTHGKVIDSPRSFLRDGTRLFFSRTSWSGRTLMPLTSLFEVRITGAKTIKRIGDALAISPDGSKLVRGNDAKDGGSQELWIINRDESNKRYLDTGFGPVFSPDGKQLAYLPQGYGHNSIMTINADGSQRKAHYVPYGVNSGVEFCLSGKALLFRVEPSPGRGSNGGLYLLTLANGQIEKAVKP